jgi:hypothetical protein
MNVTSFTLTSFLESCSTKLATLMQDKKQQKEEFEKRADIVQKVRHMEIYQFYFKVKYASSCRLMLISAFFRMLKN